MPSARRTPRSHAGRVTQSRRHEVGTKGFRPNPFAALGQLGPPAAATSKPLIRQTADMRPGILGQLVGRVVAETVALADIVCRSLFVGEVGLNPTNGVGPEQ